MFPDFYSALREYKGLILAGTVACLLAGLLLTSQQQKLYEATTVVRIVPVGDDNANDEYEASQRLARTYAEIYTRGAANSEIQALSRDPRPIDNDQLVASQVKDLDLLSVGAVTPNPQRSAQIANLAWRALERLSDRDRLVLVTGAAVPTSPTSPNLRLNGLLALLGGLILSTGLALVLHAIRQPLSGIDDVERGFGEPVLAVVPHLRPLRDGGPKPASTEGPQGRSQVAGDAVPPARQSVAEANPQASAVASQRGAASRDW